MALSATDRVNYLNIALMLISGVLAVIFPFALFLFSYAILGPLHYLTEIAWLHRRKYFMKQRHDHFLLGLICVIIVLARLAPHDIRTHIVVAATYLAFVTAGTLAFTSSWRERIGLIGCAAAFIPIVLGHGLLTVVFGVLLPTIIHVFLFTFMFILAGTLKQKSASGALSLGVFLLVSAVLLLWHPVFDDHPMPGDYIRSVYGAASKAGPKGFMMVNYVLLRMLTPGSFPSAGTAIEGVNAFLYGHPVARGVMAFIAFSYTYHYLNWFSKTSVIGWHKVPRPQLLLVVAIWAALVGLYLCDYQLGVRWLYFLSFLHVILELPLNHLTFRGIVIALRPPRNAPA